MEEQGAGPALLEDQTIRTPSSWLSLAASHGLPSSSQDRNIIIYRLCLLSSLRCPERLFVPSSTEEKSLHYKYIRHMNSSDKRQSNNLFGKLTYALLNSFIGCPTAPSGAFAAARHRDVTSSLESSQKVLPASLL